MVPAAFFFLIQSLPIYKYLILFCASSKKINWNIKRWTSHLVQFVVTQRAKWLPLPSHPGIEHNPTTVAVPGKWSVLWFVWSRNVIYSSHPKSRHRRRTTHSRIAYKCMNCWTLSLVVTDATVVHKTTPRVLLKLNVRMFTLSDFILQSKIKNKFENISD